jgi:hypothetical protein
VTATDAAAIDPPMTPRRVAARFRSDGFVSVSDIAVSYAAPSAGIAPALSIDIDTVRPVLPANQSSNC